MSTSFTSYTNVDVVVTLVPRSTARCHKFHEETREDPTHNLSARDTSTFRYWRTCLMRRLNPRTIKAPRTATIGEHGSDIGRSKASCDDEKVSDICWKIPSTDQNTICERFAQVTPDFLLNGFLAFSSDKIIGGAALLYGESRTRSRNPLVES
ncbi:hypothetical protein WG66_010042 [Moniliophthora roreri]|nr:hypothetical protein WG66_010042 [Moniliophthora roreri]